MGQTLSICVLSRRSDNDRVWETRRVSVPSDYLRETGYANKGEIRPEICREKFEIWKSGKNGKAETENSGKSRRIRAKGAGKWRIWKWEKIKLEKILLFSFWTVNHWHVFSKSHVLFKIFIQEDDSSDFLLSVARYNNWKRLWEAKHSYFLQFLIGFW